MADQRNYNSYTNQTFINDEPQPPPYSSIYPFDSAQSHSKKNEPASCVPELFQNSAEPISYDQLFLTNLPSQSHYALNTEPVVIRIETNMQNKLQKQFNLHFQKSYLIRHILFICLSSLTLISFQIVLMNYNAVLSQIASGLWSGFVNLITLLSAVLAIKYSKQWLLISSIMIHFLCITVNLGALIVINSVAATRYTSCTRPIYNTDFLVNCDESNLKYGSVAMIVLGAACMFTLTTFFFKLIAVFNNSQRQ